MRPFIKLWIFKKIQYAPLCFILFEYSDFRILWSKAEIRLGQVGAELVFMENVLTMKYILISNIQELEFSGRNFISFAWKFDERKRNFYVTLESSLRVVCLIWTKILLFKNWIIFNLLLPLFMQDFSFQITNILGQTKR